MMLQRVIMLNVFLYAVSILGTDIELNQMSGVEGEKKQLIISLPNQYYSSMTCPVSDKKNVVKACIAGGVVVVLGSVVALFLNNVLAPVCKVDVSQYPVCGGYTSDGMDQNQVAGVNFVGNIQSEDVRGTSKRLKYVDGYCEKQPLRTVCTQFNPFAYVNLPIECYAFTQGKLVGVVTATKEFQDTHFYSGNCLHAAELVEKKLNRTGRKYCKVDPNKVGFDIQRLHPILLTLFLVHSNATFDLIPHERWGNTDEIVHRGNIWGWNQSCAPQFSKNLDPNAQNAAHKRDMQKAALLLSQRSNKIAHKYSKQKYGKTKNHR